MKGFKKLAVCGMAIMLGLGSPVGNSVMNDLGYAVTAEAAGKVALSSRKTSVAVGGSKTISLKNAKGKVKWSVAKKSVASIKANGASVKVKGKKAGTTTITAKIGKKAFRCKLTVKNAPKISQSFIYLTKGSSCYLKVTGTSSSPKWLTSNKKAVIIKKISSRKCKVKAVASSGSATILAKVNGKILKCKVTIKSPSSALNPKKDNANKVTEPIKQPETEAPKPSKPETEPSKPETPSKPSEPETQKPTETEDQWGSYLENARMSKSSLSMVVGDVDSLIVSGAYGGVPFVWSSSNDSVVSVSKVTNVKYKLVAMGVGSAVVSARCGNHVYSCSVTVSNRVAPKPPETESETKPTETPSTEPTTEAPKPNPNPGQPSTEPETETGPETKPQPKLSLSPVSVLKVPGGERIRLILNTSVSEDSISYDLHDVNYPDWISIKGSMMSFIARKAGKFTIYVSGGGETLSVPIEVTSDDEVWLDYINRVISMAKSFPGSSDPLEGLKQLGAWLVDNKPYDDGQGRDHKYLFTGDIGLDCIGYSEVFMDVAKRLYGLDADYFTLSGGHTVAQIKIGETIWNFDAGTRGPAGSRGFSCGSKSLSFSYNKSEGWTRLDH